MNAKSNNKQEWLIERKYYTWYLQPPFKGKFDNTHWWDNSSEIEPIAALYEIARRHPLVYEYMIGIRHLPKRLVIHPIPFLCLYGLESWSKFGSLKQRAWQICVGNLKGVDCRDDSKKCFSIGDAASLAIEIKRAFTTKKYQKEKLQTVSRLIEEDMIKHPPSIIEKEAEIKRAALAAYRCGYLLIAVAPDIATDNAESLMAKEFTKYRKENQIHKLRARWENWLPLISNFEDAETSRKKVKSQLFNRYRRMVDGIIFF